MRTENIVIAEPCHADWDAMTGDERRRFCKACNKHVTDLSALTREEAEATVKTGICVQYRADSRGNVLFRPSRVVARSAAVAAFGLLASGAALAEPPATASASTTVVATTSSASSDRASLLDRFWRWWRGGQQPDAVVQPVEVQVDVIDTGISVDDKPPMVKGEMVWHPPPKTPQPQVTTPSN